MRALRAWIAMACALGCEGPGIAADASGAPDAIACSPSELVLAAEGERAIDVACAVTLRASEPRVVELSSEDGATLTLGDRAGAHLGPIRLDAGAHLVTAERATRIGVRNLGEPPAEVRIDRSLTWTDAALLDDRSVAGPARLLRAASSDDHGGRLLAQWFARFATTAHSERLGPQRMIDELEAAQGSDPSAWDLDALPFVVTAVHHRIDLASGSHCGELRVSLASVHPILQPFHVIFLFRQPARAGDRRPDGSAHCAATALFLARLSALDDEAFRAGARAVLDDALRADRLLVIETLELLISPWEWRQWFLEENPDEAALLPRVLENRPLFQTVDTPRLNAPGPMRDAFLAWVEESAGALSARRALIPEMFRAESARANEGVPWIPLELEGLAPAVLERHPRLRQEIEIVGCPACHASDADFVQTRADRSFSPFYTKELDARAAHLAALAVGSTPSVPHGPLQPDPVLPP